jgi:hypothetical protein
MIEVAVAEHTCLEPRASAGESEPRQSRGEREGRISSGPTVAGFELD